MSDIAIKVDHLTKEYRLGAIGGGTLRGDLQTLWARICKKEDPNAKIGARTDIKIGEKFLALDDISFEVKKGEALGIIGHNGAGKSTLLKILSRVTGPSKGSIYFNGRIASMLEVGTGFHPELTGRENIYMNGAILGMNKAEIDKKFDEIVEFAEIAKFIDTPVKRYSSGMYVKLAFSVAAHLDSEIMIMDEVLAVGDVNFQQKCLKKMRDVARNDGRTVLYVSHNMSTITTLCDRCIVLQKGHCIFDGNTMPAISFYQSSKSLDAKNYYDVRNCKRDNSCKGECHTNELFLDKFNLEMNEPLRFKIKLDSDREIHNTMVRLILFNSRNIDVGMAYSKPFALRKGENTVSLEFDTSKITPDRYYTNLVICSYNDGQQTKHDVVCDAFSFSIDETEIIHNIKWDNTCWGSFHFNDMNVIVE